MGSCRLGGDKSLPYFFDDLSRGLIMDFHFTPKEEAFRQEVRQFLKEELPPDWVGPLLAEDQFETDEIWSVGREIARKLGEKGWLALSWPKEYGGQARSHVEQLILLEEIARHRAPGIDVIGLRMVAPTIIAYGTDEQKRAHLASIAQGEVVWCEGFSEPEAGSDMAAVRTQAVENDEGFTINGQKVWTSGAHCSDWCAMLARTDPDAPKHRGISFFLVDMKTPGITVRPLINILGAYGFNEVFFDDVRVPKADLLGAKNQGWQVAMALLAFERSFIELAAGAQRILDDLVSYAKNALTLTDQGNTRSELMRSELAEMAIEVEIARLHAYRVAWMEDRGMIPESEAAMSKLYGSEVLQRVAQAGIRLLGLHTQLERESKWSPLNGTIERSQLATLGSTIYAGTSEIQRNVVAMRGLGLPRE